MFVILNYWDHKLGVTNTIEMVESRFSLRTSTPQLQLFFFFFAWSSGKCTPGSATHW